MWKIKFLQTWYLFDFEGVFGILLDNFMVNSHDNFTRPFHLHTAQSQCLIVSGKDGGLSTLCHSCGFARQQMVLNTFPGPGYLHSEDGVVWIWHFLVNLCIYVCIYIIYIHIIYIHIIYIYIYIYTYYAYIYIYIYIYILLMYYYISYIETC